MSNPCLHEWSVGGDHVGNLYIECRRCGIYENVVFGQVARLTAENESLTLSLRLSREECGLRGDQITGLRDRLSRARSVRAENVRLGQTILGLEMSLMRNKECKRHVEVALAWARLDTERLDWLSGELGREQARIVDGDEYFYPLFRRNAPITRESIDEEIQRTTSQPAP